MKKVEIILGNEKHVLVPDGDTFRCFDECSLYKCCEELGFASSTLCASLQDLEGYEDGHFEKVS